MIDQHLTPPEIKSSSPLETKIKTSDVNKNKRGFDLISSPITLVPNEDLPIFSNIEPYDLSAKPVEIYNTESLLDIFNESPLLTEIEGDAPSLVSADSKEEQPQPQKKPKCQKNAEEEAPKEPPKKKRRKKRNSKNHKFRPYQAEKWQERYNELLQFKKDKDHCLVPHTYPENPPLARWVKRQRYQYKLMQESKQSSMTQERIKILEDIGFIWDSHEAAWEERLKELLDFKTDKGNCLVPSNYPDNSQLATWVKCQRRQYKLYWEGRPSNMTVERIMILENHGFEWELRASSSYTKRCKQEAGANDPLLGASDPMFMDLMSDLSEDDLSAHDAATLIGEPGTGADAELTFL